MTKIQSGIIEFHCPRWNELPDVDLYMDQVVSVLEKNLSVFSQIEGEKVITPTMINNYVKQKLVLPPEKKRYNKEHLSCFFIICLMKRILSISEISRLLAYISRNQSMETGYDLFCTELEKALKDVLMNKNTVSEAVSDFILIRSAVLALAYKLNYQIGTGDTALPEQEGCQ